MTSAGLLGWLLAVYFKDSRAVSILEGVVTNRREIVGANDPRTIDAASDLSMAIGHAGDWPRAEALQREALSRSVDVLRRTRDDTLNCMSFLADALFCQDRAAGKRSEYFDLRREVYLTKLKRRGPLDRVALLAMSLMLREVDPEEIGEQETCELHRDCIDKTNDIFGVDHQGSLTNVLNFGIFLRAKNRWEEAEQLYVQTLDAIKNGPREGITTTRQRTAKMKEVLHEVRERANLCENSGNATNVFNKGGENGDS